MYGPTSSPEREIIDLVNEIPRAYIRLSILAEEILADIGLSGPARGVLRDLFVDGERTAPDLARTRPVTRQAIQPILDELVAKGLVHVTENPRHQRSWLYALTPAGIDICVEVERREIAEIRRWAGDVVAPASFAGAAEALKLLNRVLLGAIDARAAAPQRERSPAS
jgi:DNA-binding MarR family transcriptional regulator